MRIIKILSKENSVFKNALKIKKFKKDRNSKALFWQC